MFLNSIKLFKYKILFISDPFILCPQGHKFHSQALLAIHLLHKVQRMNEQGKRSMKIKVLYKNNKIIIIMRNKTICRFRRVQQGY